MKSFAMIAVSTLLVLGCSKSNDSTAARPETQGTPATAPASTELKQLGLYLGGATKVTVYTIRIGDSDAKKTQVNVLDEAATKGYLATLDLKQLADGPVVKCPNDMVVEFADASGALLGTIGLCQGNASFTLPDGTRQGGIRAKAP